MRNPCPTPPIKSLETSELAQKQQMELTTTPTGSGRRKPRVKAQVVQIEGSIRRVARPPNDDDFEIWRSQLKEALGTSSDAFVQASLRQLIEANKLPGQAVACTTSLSAALAFIASLDPENEAQAALAVQLAAQHSASMNVLGRLHGVSEHNMITMASAGAKLGRAFQSGLETYYRLKRGVHQVVRIERVEVREGGQAVIGVVNSQ